MNTLPVCLMSRVMWKPQAAGWWMKYFSLTLANYAGQAWLCIGYCCSRRQCHHRYPCWLLAPKECIFAESEERCLCFQVCLWCSTVRWMNGKYISTKKKKKRVDLFLQSKNHQSHTSARAQGKMHLCSYYRNCSKCWSASVLIHVLPIQL